MPDPDDDPGVHTTGREPPDVLDRLDGVIGYLVAHSMHRMAASMADAIAEIREARARPALAWSKERPTEPGWYWVRGTDDRPQRRLPYVVRVAIDPASLALTISGVPLPDCWEWSGPIPEPGEAPKEGDDACQR